MDDETENQSDLPRFSLNTWTPARCHNSALQDEHGQAFYDFANGTGSGFTPRRSGRLRRAVEYPRDGKLSTPKRRKTKKMKNVKTEDLSVDEAVSGCAPATISSNSSTAQLNTAPESFTPETTTEEKAYSDFNFEEDIKFTRAIETIEIFDSPIEAMSGIMSTNSPKTVIKRPKPQPSSANQLASFGKEKIKVIVTPGKSIYSAYFSDRPPNAGSSIKKTRSGTDKKLASAKTNYTQRRMILETDTGQQLKGNRSPVPSDGKILKPIKRLATPKTRLKLPNFKAIHQNQFDKMISIVDDIAKKRERAAQAFNFASDENKLHYNDRITPAKSNSTAKIGSNTKNKAALSNHNSKPRKRIEISKIPIFVKNVDDHVSKVIEFKATSSKPFSQREDKIGERRKKNMNMYKNGFQRSEKNERIRGVRSNRRFDLQMIYRDSLK